MHILPIVVAVIASITAANAAGSCNQPSPDGDVDCTCADYCQCDANIHTDLQLKEDCLEKARLVFPGFVFNGDVTDDEFGHHHHHSEEESEEDDGGDHHGHSHDRRKRQCDDTCDNPDHGHAHIARDHGHAHASHGHAHDGTEPESHWDHHSDDSDGEEEQHNHDPVQEQQEIILDKCLHINFGLSPHPCDCHCDEDPIPAISSRRKRSATDDEMQINGERAFLKCYQEAFQGCNRHCTDRYQNAFQSCKEIAEVATSFLD